MKILTTPPPNFIEWKRHFPLIGTSPQYEPIFAYQSVIHNPFNRTITKDLEVHEEVHERQQGNFPEIWHDKYFNDPSFRLEQEIEAYGEQYLFIKQFMHGSLLSWGLDKMAEALSGPLYGNLLTFGEARSKIRNYCGIIIGK